MAAILFLVPGNLYFVPVLEFLEHGKRAGDDSLLFPSGPK